MVGLVWPIKYTFCGIDLISNIIPKLQVNGNQFPRLDSMSLPVSIRGTDALEVTMKMREIHFCMKVGI